MNSVKIGQDLFEIPIELLEKAISSVSSYSKALELHSTKLNGHVEISDPKITKDSMDTLISFCKTDKLSIKNVDLQDLITTFSYFGISQPASLEIKAKKLQSIKSYADYEKRRKEYQFKLFSGVGEMVASIYMEFLDGINKCDFYSAKPIVDWTTSVVMSTTPQFNSIKFELSIGARSNECELDSLMFPELYKVVGSEESRERCLDDLVMFVAQELGFEGDSSEVVKGCRRWEVRIPP